VIGPNPNQLHSFLELHKSMSPVWIVCEPCRRYVRLPPSLGRRDITIKTFSCSVCGGEGKTALEDPFKDGLQPDPQPRPLRHPMAAMRLRMLHELADPFGHQKAARESLPQRSKPYLERMPRFRLKPMPFRTFGDLPALGLRLEVYCPSCHTMKPVEIDDRLAGRRWGRVRFTCSGSHYTGSPCRSRGHLHIRPAEPQRRNRPFVSLECGCRHTPWFGDDIRLDEPPWTLAPIDTGRERYACPSCGGQVRTTFHDGLDAAGAGFAGHILAPRRIVEPQPAPTPLVINEAFYPVPFF
jgi:hypothetical protein